jgi:hypothetical protein
LGPHFAFGTTHGAGSPAKAAVAEASPAITTPANAAREIEDVSKHLFSRRQSIDSSLYIIKVGLLIYGTQTQPSRICLRQLNICCLE